MALEIWSIISPFLAAILASGLTLHFGLKKMRAAHYFEERIASIKAIYKRMSAINAYCLGRMGELEGNENSPAVAIGDGNKSALILMHQLDEVFYSNRVFLEPDEIKMLDKLIKQLSMNASMERMMLGTDEFDESAIPAYESTLNICGECVDLMYQDIRSEFSK